jgi:hypothetical protein
MHRHHGGYGRVNALLAVLMLFGEPGAAGVLEPTTFRSGHDRMLMVRLDRSVGEVTGWDRAWFANGFSAMLSPASTRVTRPHHAIWSSALWGSMLAWLGVGRVVGSLCGGATDNQYVPKHA